MINVPKGTKDVLPEDSYKWHYVEKAARETAALFNASEIRTPTFEATELFARGVGDTTDVVTKEMYTFIDKGNRSMTLKPEGTAGVARSFIENGLSGKAMPLKMYYITPVFRYERPQAGRLREHHQFGVEFYGSASYVTDAEVILLAKTLLNKVGVNALLLKINSIGCKECRPKYNEALKEYLRPHLGEMCPTCRERFEKNPLRIIDCKEEGCKKIVANAPSILDYLCDDCNEHFTSLQSLLSGAGVEYIVLAGWLLVIPADFIQRFENRILNIHPALIPSFCGMGYYGLRVHKAVIEYGAKISGATVHFVEADVDGGAIIMQRSVPVLDDDTPESLQRRVLQEEHKMLPLCVKLLVEGKVCKDGRKVSIKE